MVALTKQVRRTNESRMAAQRKQLALRHLHKEFEVAPPIAGQHTAPAKPVVPGKDRQPRTVFEVSSTARLKKDPLNRHKSGHKMVRAIRQCAARLA